MSQFMLLLLHALLNNLFFGSWREGRGESVQLLQQRHIIYNTLTGFDKSILDLFTSNKLKGICPLHP